MHLSTGALGGAKAGWGTFGSRGRFDASIEPSLYCKERRTTQALRELRKGALGQIIE